MPIFNPIEVKKEQKSVCLAVASPEDLARVIKTIHAFNQATAFEVTIAPLLERDRVSVPDGVIVDRVNILPAILAGYHNILLVMDSEKNLELIAPTDEFPNKRIPAETAEMGAMIQASIQERNRRWREEKSKGTKPFQNNNPDHFANPNILTAQLNIRNSTTNSLRLAFFGRLHELLVSESQQELSHSLASSPR